MKIVLCCGVFDIFHVGHLKHLKKAKSLGDYLVVAVTADEYVNKGDGRPVFTLKQRMEMLKSLRCVDQVVASHCKTPEKMIKRWRPHIYVKGDEYKGRLPEQKLVEELGGRVVFTNEVVYSSTALCSIL